MTKLKSIQKLLLFVLSIFLLILIVPTKVCYADDDDEGFYIEHMNIQVTANSDRTYDIVETINVYFTEERHGILRTIPTSSSLEREIRIENVEVTGAPFEYDGDGTIKIGDADKTVKGQQQYVISYRIWQYADSELDADYLYLNVIGTEWSTYIESFDAQITLPNNTTVQNCTLTGGTSGSTDSDMATYTVDGNIITLESTRQLSSYEGVTIMVQMPEGTFSDAEVWSPDITIHSIDADYQLDDHGVLSVRKVYDVTLWNQSVIALDTKDTISSDYLLKKATVTLPDQTQIILTKDELYYLNLDSYLGQRLQFTLEYTKAYDVTIGFSDMALYAQLYTYQYNQNIENISVTFHTPFAINEPTLRYSDTSYSDDVYTSYSLTLDSEATSGELTYEDSSDLTRDVYLRLPMENTRFVRDPNFYDYLIPILGILITIVLLFVSQKNKRSFNPVPCFYPPEDLNPAEIAYVMNNVCLSSDIVTLLYYWASKGLLTIQFKGKSHFTLTKLKEMDQNFRPYEHSLYTHLWKKGKNTTTDSYLENSYYKYINAAISKLNKIFIDNDLLYDDSSYRWSRLLGLLLPECYLFLIAIADCYRGFGIVGPIFMATYSFLYIIFLYRLGLAFQNLRMKKTGLLSFIIKSIIVCGLFGIHFILFIDGQIITSTSSMIAYICTIAISVLGASLRKYSQKRHQLLEQTVGFRMFLVTAEKERLKMLLDENPEYYYDILPYAQVLDVTDQWTHRFDGLTIEPPTWYYDNSSHNTFNTMRFHQLNRSMTNKMTSTPASSGSSSSGGYSSGGSSGGGSGGGGGSSW